MLDTLNIQFCLKIKCFNVKYEIAKKKKSVLEPRSHMLLFLPFFALFADSMDCASGTPLSVSSWGAELGVADVPPSLCSAAFHRRLRCFGSSLN